jgi:hypothetical protein
MTLRSLVLVILLSGCPPTPMPTPIPPQGTQVTLTTVGGDLFAERLLKNIDDYMQRSCTIRQRRRARARAPSY